MKQHAFDDDEASGAMVVVRAILAATVTLIVAGLTVDLPSVDPVAVVTGLLRMLMG